MKMIDQNTYDIIVDALKLIVENPNILSEGDQGRCIACYKLDYEHESDCLLNEVLEVYDTLAE